MILAPYGHIPGSFPYEAIRSTGGKGTYLCPHDPYYYQRGEIGYYHDTQLGRARRPGFWSRLFNGRKGLGQTIPTDAELSTYVREYTPYNFGWLATTNGRFIQATGWHPGPSPAGPPAPISYGRSIYLNGAGGLGQATPQDVLSVLNEHQKRMFQLSLITTIAVTASALLAIFRTGGLLREDIRRRAG